MIVQTKITFKNDGSPYSSQFGDIYFDTNHGTSQSECIFIDGNNLKARLARYPEKFVIAETGFGTGLNFLLTLAVFDKIKSTANLQNSAPAKASALHFISVEKYPLSKQQLAQSLAVFPQLKEYSQQLINQYPEPFDKDITLSFLEGSVTLQLIFNDATQGLTQLGNAKEVHFSTQVDAWFLD
ncbi:MAG: tRNA 5-methylaminomethyl-2-thiouridine biosynthesis bifunctional protein, partial [Colwellia sp.]